MLNDYCNIMDEYKHILLISLRSGTDLRLEDHDDDDEGMLIIN